MAGLTTRAIVGRQKRRASPRPTPRWSAPSTPPWRSAAARIILGRVVAMYVEDRFVDPPVDGHGPCIHAEGLHAMGRVDWAKESSREDTRRFTSRSRAFHMTKNTQRANLWPLLPPLKV